MLKKIDTMEIKAKAIIGKFSDDDLNIYRRANDNIKACKISISKIIDSMSQQISVQSDIWRKYEYPEETNTELLNRGLAICVNTKDGKIRVAEINEVEKVKALLPYLF